MEKYIIMLEELQDILDEKLHDPELERFERNVLYVGISRIESLINWLNEEEELVLS